MEAEITKAIGKTEAIEKPVDRSRDMVKMTIFVAALLIGIFAVWMHKEAVLWFYVLLVACLLVPALWLMPVRVGVRDGVFYVKRLFKTKVIPVDRIKEVRPFETSMADGKICGLSGFYCKVGWFKSWEIGLYFAYIGNYSETFLVELKPDRNGRVWRYICSCKDYGEVVDVLNTAIKN